MGLRSWAAGFFLFFFFCLEPWALRQAIWASGCTPAPSLDSASTHTPLGRPSAGSEAKPVEFLKFPVRRRQTPRESCGPASPRLGSASLGHTWLPQGSGQTSPPHPLAPLLTPRLLYRRGPLRAWLPAAQVPAHRRLRRPDSPRRLLGLTGSPNKVRAPRGLPASTLGSLEQTCTQVDPCRGRGAGVPSSRSQNMEGRLRLRPSRRRGRLGERLGFT